MAVTAVAVVVVPKVVVAKVADQPKVAVAKGMAVDGPVEQGIYLVDGEAMHQLVAGKSKLGASNSVDWDLLQFALMDSYCFFAAVAVNYFKH
ncbi:MAG: hypothetical protein ACN6OY_01615 [Pseudomonas alloputida]|uniref:hypothetical protein n=1 Tax=Delftia acidovorans TaxID=80866 RepID=UPI00192BB6C2|nr:hypothetical protein [Delftia acidovorans]